MAEVVILSVAEASGCRCRLDARESFLRSTIRGPILAANASQLRTCRYRRGGSCHCFGRNLQHCYRFWTKGARSEDP
jgi:hypothetical protein